MSFQLFKRLTLRDKLGRITYDSGSQKSHSFILQFLQIWSDMLVDRVSPISNIKEIDGNSYNIVAKSIWDSADYPFSIDGAAGEEHWGIVLGSGDQAEANDNYRLETKIDHGTGAGELQHGITTYVAPAVVGSYVELKIIRTFTNGSGAGVEVKEMGMQVRFQSSPGARYALILRDVLSPSITVPNGEVLTVNYFFRTQV